MRKETRFLIITTALTASVAIAMERIARRYWPEKIKENRALPPPPQVDSEEMKRQAVASEIGR